MENLTRVIIVGGGISGMTTAIALQQKGIDVHVIEKGRREEQVGTGINLQQNALLALRQAGILDECLDAGFAWDTVTIRGEGSEAGTTVSTNRLPWPDIPGVPAALGIMRPVLAEILARNAIGAGANIYYNTTVTALEQNSDYVEVALSDGRTLRGDVLVAADGTYSQIRKMVFGEHHKPVFAGQGAWRYTVPRPETLTGFTAFPNSKRGSFGFLPLAEDVGYFLYTETSDKPLRIEEDQLRTVFAERLEDFDAPEFQVAADMLSEKSHLSYRPFDIMLMPQPWFENRVVLVGDAAHSVTPQLTSGGGMAVEDAVVLTEELLANGPATEALARYSARREERVSLVYKNSLMLCEIEKAKDEDIDPTEVVQILVNSFKYLASPY